MQRDIKHKLYIIGNYFNYGLIAWFVLVIIMGIAYPSFSLRLFNSDYLFILLSIPTLIVYQYNISISLKYDTIGQSILLILGLIFYNPFYSKKVLRNNWI